VGALMGRFSPTITANLYAKYFQSLFKYTS
jgi:hypothetical protein